jgi:hypothetical protein
MSMMKSVRHWEVVIMAIGREELEFLKGQYHQIFHALREGFKNLNGPASEKAQPEKRHPEGRRF